MNKQPNITGFTLIEAIITILILAVLAAVAAPRFTNMIENQRAATASMTLKSLFLSQRRYFVDHDAYAPNAASLDIVPDVPNGFGLSVSSNPSGLATLTRVNGPNYRLRINADGVISCFPGAYCANISAGMMGR